MRITRSTERSLKVQYLEYSKIEKEKRGTTYFIVILPLEGEKCYDEFWRIGLRHNSRVH